MNTAEVKISCKQPVAGRSERLKSTPGNRASGDASAVSEGRSWRANLQLEFYASAERTCMHRQHRGPLRVQRPFYPDGSVCHTYILHPPGGIVGGDSLELAVQTRRGAHALVTTPGAAKFYRSAGGTATVHQQLQVDGTLEWLPQESILFGGSEVKMQTRVDVSAGGRFVGWDLFNFGRPAAQDAYIEGSLVNRWQLFRDNKPVLLDRLMVDAACRHASSGLRGESVYGALVALPFDSACVDQLRRCIGRPERCVVTAFDDLLVVRYLGSDNEECRSQLEIAWRAIRRLVLPEAIHTPRIWAT